MLFYIEKEYSANIKTNGRYRKIESISYREIYCTEKERKESNFMVH
jgi:hypothetical protein